MSDRDRSTRRRDRDTHTDTTDEVAERLAAAADASGRDPVGLAPTRVLVLGGGASGLVAARDCARPGFEVTVLEAKATAGGGVARHEVAGLSLDAGAESFATRGGAVADLIEELGMTDRVARPHPAGAWLRLADRTVPMPKAGMLGIPTSPLASDVVAAIGWRGALRAYLDRLMPVMKVGQEHNLGRLVRRRMGRAVLDRLVSPIATGVYSAAADELDVGVVARGLNGALTRTGSLSGAVTELRAAASKAGSAAGGLVGGMATLIDALLAELDARGGTIRYGARVVAVRPWPEESDAVGLDAAAADTAEGVAPSRWQVELDDGELIPADAVLVALPGVAAVAALTSASEATAALAALEWPSPTSVELATLVLDAPGLDAAPRGTGLLVADDAHDTVTAKALTHATVKWSWLAEQAGEHRHVLRLSYGRAGHPSDTEELTDEQLCALALRDASVLLDMPLAASMLVGFDRVRWTNALPHAALGQRERIQAVRDAVDALEGIEVTGAWLTGTGLASVVPDARHAARRVRGLRWRTLTETHGSGTTDREH